MKAITLCISILLFSFFASAQNKDPKTFKMGEYTIKQYYFVMLTKGGRRDEIKDTAIINKLQAGHMANMERLSKEGKLMLAGPFGDDGNWRGIFVFDAESEDEVKSLLATDPAIKAGRLDYEIHPWYTAMNSVFK
ncbi:MAG: hypothetical protein KF744_13120 [Taibaiella sp.]|nr:hypothetical protein [Taibaiella sp.]